MTGLPAGVVGGGDRDGLGADTGVRGPRIFLAVEPPLLAGALAWVLSADCQVVLAGAGPAGQVGRVDLAIVNGPSPPDVDAELVIRVTDDPGPGPDGALDTLTDLLEAVRRSR